jgi:glycine/D-amino acid oxidase-like deaminating enzyme
MQLRSGLPIWRMIHPEPAALPSLADDIRCDALVIGGGISGAMIAHDLVREGIDTVLIDKRHPGLGSTAASTGLLQYEIDSHLCDLIEKVGEDHAVHAYHRGLRAIDEIEAMTLELHDRCGFARRESLYFASSDHDGRELKREYDCRRHFGFDVRWLDRDELREFSSIDAPGAIVSRGDAQIDPYRFTQLVLDRAQASGLRVYSQTNVQSMDESGGVVIARAQSGSVTSRRVIYATGYESEKYLGQKVGSLHSTYAVASEPLESFTPWPNQCLIWETARPYFYARQSEDGRALIGGEDTDFSTDHQRDELVERQVNRLMLRFSKLFPDIPFEPAVAWAGTFGETEDGLAYIGQPPNRPLAYFALGYGGNGITFGMIAAKLIADLYVGRRNADAEVFGFGRR